MTQINHIAGGVVITGTICSLFSINIFQNPYILSLVIFASLLPDIDHPKSLLGKIFYPLAKFLSKRYGHRTITHSILFHIITTFAVYIIQKLYFPEYRISLIFYFAVFSHLLLDMLTVQGIPLFYPFFRNPCVIPANPNYRIRNANNTQQGIMFIVFIVVGFSLQNLFANGFWATYNKQFNDIQHVYRAMKKTNNYISVDYKFDQWENTHIGTGYLLFATTKEIHILNKNHLIRLINGKQGLIIHKLTANTSKLPMTVKTISFYNISLDSLNILLKNKYIVSSSIHASSLVISSDGLSNTTFEFANTYNISFVINQSLSDNTYFLFKKDSLSRAKKIQDKTLSLRFAKLKIAELKNKHKFLLTQKRNLIDTIEYSNNNFHINEAKSQLIKINEKISNYMPPNSTQILLLKSQLANLEKEQENAYSQQETKKNKPHFYGTFQYFLIPEF